MSNSLNIRLKRLEKIITNVKTQHVKINKDFSIEFLDALKRVYYPSPTARFFHGSNMFVRHIMGPYGSGKSTICLMEILIRACNMPACLDGIRRSKIVIIRNTSAELETSVYASWMTWFAELGTIRRRKRPVLTVEHTFNDGKGLVEMDVVFLALDNEDDLKKLKSTEFTMAYLNEVCELPEQLLPVVQGRIINRYPAKSICPFPYFNGLIMDTNPPPTDHWLYHLFEIKKPETYQIFKQPAGLLKTEEGWVSNPNAENLNILNADGKEYYVLQSKGATEEYIKVYCCGEYGVVITGKPVYPSYNDDLHSIDDLPIDSESPIYMGWDFGLTPACIITQFVMGQLRIIKEFVSDNCTVQDLVKFVVKPWLNKNVPPTIEIISDSDPSDPHASSDGTTSRQVLAENGIPTTPAITNNPIQRIDAVKDFLSSLSIGKPSLILSKKGCPILRDGFLGKYHYKRLRVLNTNAYQDKPNKIHPVSDIHDALQYVALRIIFKRDQSYSKVNIKDFIDNSSFM